MLFFLCIKTQKVIREGLGRVIFRATILTIVVINYAFHLHLQVSECHFPLKRAPPLALLFSACKNMHLWLRQNPKNMCVVHCLDGRSGSAVLTCSILCFCRLFDTVSASMHLFTTRRGQASVSPSQRR